MAMFTRILVGYQTLSTKYPYLSNCTLGFVIAGFGDYLCQKYFEIPSKAHHEATKYSLNSPFHERINIPQHEQQNNSPKISVPSASSLAFEWDKERSVRMGLIRAFVITPFVIFWYPFVTSLSPGQTFFRILQRVLIDSVTGSPIVISLVFAGNSVLNNDLNNLFTQFKQSFFETWLTGIKYWPFVHMITFGLVPPPFQPLFTHFASVYWNAVISYYSNKKIPTSPPPIQLPDPEAAFESSTSCISTPASGKLNQRSGFGTKDLP
jgi:hypothetical protein